MAIKQKNTTINILHDDWKILKALQKEERRKQYDVIGLALRFYWNRPRTNVEKENV